MKNVNMPETGDIYLCLLYIYKEEEEDEVEEKRR